MISIQKNRRAGGGWGRGILWVAGLCALAAAPSAAQDEAALEAMRRINPQMQPPMEIDEEAVAAAGIRRLDSKHLRLYTDLPEEMMPGQMGALFDAAVPLWCKRFGINPAKAGEWRISGFLMLDRERFGNAHLLPPELPDFPTGYNRGHQIWVVHQPGNYYTRHMVLHEGTHAFMQWFLGGSGPPWYSEGMAELLGLHRIGADGVLEIGVRVRRREDCEYWGRVKVIRDAVAAGQAKRLAEVFDMGPFGFADVEAYAWSWAACEFLSGHPLASGRFQQLAERAGDLSPRFTVRFREWLKKDWAALERDWKLFLAEMEYGTTAADSRLTEAVADPSDRSAETFEVAANRSWQATTVEVRAGDRIRIEPSGRFEVAGGESPWPCEAGGITLEYHRGRPLGMLMAGVLSEFPGGAEVVEVVEAGRGGEFVFRQPGRLLLRINESPARLDDNSGSLKVRLSPVEQGTGTVP